MKSIIDPSCYALRPPDLDLALDGDGLACQTHYDRAVARLTRAKSEEDRSKAQEEVRRWSQLALEGSNWTIYKIIEPIGQLYRRSDGKFHLSLSTRLENIRQAFLVAADNDSSAEAVNKVLWLIMHGGLGAGSLEMASALNWQKVQECLGERLRALTSCPAHERAKQAQRLKNDLADAVDRIAKPGFAKPRSNASQVSVCDETGKERLLRLEVLVIDTARQLAERHQDTPAKGDIRVALCACFPNLLKNKDSTWTDVWERCGLDELPRAAKW